MSAEATEIIIIKIHWSDDRLCWCCNGDGGIVAQAPTRAELLARIDRMAPHLLTEESEVCHRA